MLAPGECHLWWATPEPAHAGMAALLDTDELRRAEAFRHPSDRLRYITAHGLARLLVGDHLGVDPATVRFTARCNHCGGPHGKPRIAAPPGDLHLSWSHAGDRVVVALARQVEVGVDVEATDHSWDPVTLQDTVLSASERAALQRLPEADRAVGMLRYWTRKEAVLKATGDGLGQQPNTLTVSAPDEPARLLASPRPLVAQLEDLDPGEGYVACLALLSAQPHRVVQATHSPTGAAAQAH